MIFTKGGDYIPGPYPVTFKATETSSSFYVILIDDEVVENNENLILSIDEQSLPNGCSVGKHDQAYMIIIDDDSK